MTAAVRICACLALLTIGAAVGIIGYQAAVLPGRVTDAAGKAAEATRSDLVAGAIGGKDSRGREQRGALPALAGAADKIGNTADGIGATVYKVGEVVEKLASTLEQTRKDFAETQANLRGQILWLRTMSIEPAIREYSRVPGDLRPVLASTDELLAQTSGTVAVLRPQALGLIAAAKKTAGDWATMSRTANTAFPRFVALGESFVTESQSVAANINRLTKPRWYDRLLGYGLNGAVLYRNLNPATNLTVKGATFISGKP